ncbi:hydantoinase/oxoprolinase family protein [Natronomonas sp. F2-12]|jgi:N-methylhydantoinase A|uniref:Hydantoinase/oxoprolinase family protein n=1 Tax=Natronomonas aquatica TaxID=2841590 RepID=A0A9R1CVU4_9EURY|nr:hydantoinase/oxoprolinase family protein [Natronomonas aquatica]MCQ4334677.1 hydantoinase/oxoprolinase family protein [Natronomonas aquatica]
MTGAQIGVDVGGTFTDVALFLDGDLVTAKVPTTADQSVGVIEGIRKACDEAGIAPGEIDTFAHAMTVSVNALLERDGAKTALVTTEGFRDVLEIGRQDRPALYDLDAEKPDPLVPRRRRFELDERATPEGIERGIDEPAVREIADEIARTGAESVAVCLLFAYAHPGNESRVADILREELSVPVSVSHEVLSEFREFERTATTVADAYVRPAIEGYLGRLIDRARETGLPAPRVMKSNGGVAEAETVRSQAVTTVLSGPAAGVVGASSVGADTGAVTFDMGGTSSDVSLVREGEIERSPDTEIAGVPIRTPMVDIETVGAGGGSIAWTDPGGALRVGPESAGADPGPACYGGGGERPTVTDANVVLGYIGEGTALGGELELDVEAAHEALDGLAAAAGLEDATAAARGVYRVANATMTRAIRSVTVERGYDPRDFDLVAFGGAGPMHAVALADRLGIDRVLVPGPAGVLSAYGLLTADETHDRARTARIRLSEATAEDGRAVYETLVESALGDVSDTGAARIERAADCRYSGQGFELTVPVDRFDPDRLAGRFGDAHERAYGYRLEEPVEAVTLRVTATVGTDRPTPRHAGSGEALRGRREAVFPDTGRVEATVYDRGALGVGETVAGPAILEQPESTTVVPPAWRGRVRDDGTLAVERADGSGEGDR